MISGIYCSGCALVGKTTYLLEIFTDLLFNSFAAIHQLLFLTVT